MLQENCPHFEKSIQISYLTSCKLESEANPNYPCIEIYQFPKPAKLEVKSSGGGMVGREPFSPDLSQIYDGAEDGETMDYPAEGKCNNS